MGIESIRQNARRSLHDFMGRPAHYYATPSSARLDTKARAHSKRGVIGDLPGTNLNYAETYDRRESVVLWADDIPVPVVGALIVFSDSEGYWVHTVEPRDGQTITVNVTKATASELAGLPYPGA